MSDDLEELIEINKIDFENSMLEVMKLYKEQISDITKDYNKVVKTFTDIEYYKQNGYYIKYYISTDKSIEYKAIKKEVGFKPNN